MIWLSSYPRSGNTFLRNVLFEVYGISSSSFYEGKGEPDNYVEFPVVKTHHMPENVFPQDPEIKSVYLIRDGRDAIVSMAHQQIQIYNSTRSFEEIFREATVASKGSYFGGWGPNVNAWLEKAAILIRFEELIEHPLEQVARLEQVITLPQKKKDSAPTFQELKHGKPKYGRGKRISSSVEEEEEIIKKSFRRGKAFGWKDELTKELQNFFWAYHRNTMEKMGYDINGGINPLHPDLDFKAIELLGHKTPNSTSKRFKVLIEANKLLMLRNDGVKRYQLELLKALYPLTKNPDSRWQIDVMIRGSIISLAEYGDTLFDVNKSENNSARFNESAHLAKQYLKAGISHVKSWVPIPVKDYIKNRYRQLLIKAGLKYADHPILGKLLKKNLNPFSNNGSNDGVDQEVEVMNEYDLIHVPLPQHFEPFKHVNTKFIVTVHDITHRLFSQYHTSNNIQMAEDGFNFFIEKNADYICISENTKKDFVDHYNVANNKLHKVLEAADNEKFKPPLNRDSGMNTRLVYEIPPDPYIMTLSTLEPRKNLVNTIKAFELLLEENPDIKCNLVVAGNKGWDTKDILKLKHKENIHFTSFVNENDLPDLYREAEALCYVSYYEGFGLPPLEAMSCQTPVIYGDNSSMKELFEGFGLPADPSDVIDIKNQMRAILTDADLKKDLSNKALERSFDFSWRRTAIDTLQAFEKVITRQ